MKKVLLLGDSIRMGYDDYVKEALDGKCEVVYDAEDNGRFAAYTLWQAKQMFKHHGHFALLKAHHQAVQRKRREDHLRDHHADFGARHGGRQHRHAGGQHQLQ